MFLALKCNGAMIQDEEYFRHLVFLSLMAVFHIRMAGETPEMDYFIYRRVSNRIRHYFLLGNQNGIFRLRANRKIAVPHCFDSRLSQRLPGRKMSKSLGNGIDPLEVIG